MQGSKLDPLSPVHGHRRTTPAPDRDISLSNGLKASAKKKFDAGFSASISGHQSRPGTPNLEGGRRQQGEEGRPQRPPLPARCNSVLGLRSDERKVDGTLRNSDVENEQLSLDYVDLESLLQEKMKEFNSQMPRSKTGKKSRRPSDFKISEHEQDLDTDYKIDSSDYTKRVKEASYLFKLCQKEIKLQIKIHCPERARLCEKSLDFFSTVLECLVQPLAQYKTDIEGLRQWRDADQEYQATVLAQTRLALASSPPDFLSSPGWLRGGAAGAPQAVANFIARGETASYKECVEALAAGLPAAIQSLLLLQRDKEEMEAACVPKTKLEEALAAGRVLEERLEEERRKAVEAAVGFNEEKRRLEESLASAEQGLRNITAAKEALDTKFNALQAEAVAVKAELEGAQKERFSRAEELRLKAEESKERGARLAEGARQLAELQERLHQLTSSEVQLTPRPTWAGREIGGAGSTTQARVCVAMEEWSKAEERARELAKEVAEKTEREEAMGQEIGELRKCKEQLDAMLSVVKCDAACGCPEKKAGEEEVEVEEYLQMYLTKRFGLQGVSSSWEVERMAKDFGWVMQAQVRMRAGET